MALPMFYYWIVLLLLIQILVGCAGGTDSEANLAGQEALKRGFQESMSGVVLEGFFTVNDRDGGPRKERYQISKMSKLAGDYWVCQARIQYGSHDVTVPVPVKVKWAGDTPILTLTDVAIPGLGTFTARVLFYDKNYVGVWRHGEHSGQHFGRIIPESEDDLPSD